MINKDLSIDFLGVHFENPFCLSSSPVGNCYDMCAKAFDEGWGGIGFKNMEQIAEHPLQENLNDLRRLKQDYPTKIVIASIMGTNEEDWEELARLVTEAGSDMIEMNLSCPQMTSHEMGSDVGTNPELVKKYCEAVKRGSSLPMMAKMTPNITDMVPAAQS
nr:tRNA-dihydrouridine synthase [Secundilactobacillus kimchicus]